MALLILLVGIKHNCRLINQSINLFNIQGNGKYVNNRKDEMKIKRAGQPITTPLGGIEGRREIGYRCSLTMASSETTNSILHTEKMPSIPALGSVTPITAPDIIRIE
jgi:hypothetical protein